MKRKKTKARTLLCVTLALVIAMGSVSVVSAKTVMGNVGVVRLSNTSAIATASAEFDRKSPTCSAKIILQEKYNDNWRTATGVPTAVITKFVYGQNQIFFPYTFTLVKGKVYRTKAVFTEIEGSFESIATCLSSIF